MSLVLKSLPMLKQTHTDLLKRYTDDSQLINGYWDEIVEHYSSEGRHYHTLEHLENLLARLMEVKDLIQNWDSILFTLYYHDIIYDVQQPDNEEKSADFAEKRMKELDVPMLVIERCKEQILATKSHVQSTDSDTNYFTDADLSILGQNWEAYETYYQNVRKEYSIYPKIFYNPGRKKVLRHFLAMERIYKTDFFFHQLEQQAKQNLQQEMDLL